MQVDMLKAKSQFSKLVKAALDGEDVIVANRDKPMVRLVKLADQPKTRGYGAWNLVEMAEDWDSPETNAAIARLILDRPIASPEPARAPTRADPRASKRET